MADSTYCRDCGAPVLWAKNTKGHRVLLDPDVVPLRTDGALATGEGAPGTLYAWDVAGLAQGMAERFNTTPEKVEARLLADYEGRMPHTASCTGRRGGRRRRVNA